MDVIRESAIAIATCQCWTFDNSSEFTLMYFRISVYEVKAHNRAGGSADVSAPSLPWVRLTPLEIENGKGLVHRRMVRQCGDAHKHT